MENKKTLILSIIGVLVLIIAVVGVSFAMYSFSATGTRENVIQTGSVTLDFNGEGSCSVEGNDTYQECEAAGGVWTGPNVISLTNEYPKTDDKGLENDAVTFTVGAEYEGDMTIDYALQFVDIEEQGTLTDDMIKLQIMKNDGTVSYPMGSATSGASMNTVAATTNTLTGADGYVFDTGYFTTKGTVTYTIRAWVSDQYNLVVPGANAGTCSIAEHTTAAACATAGGTWTQTLASQAETFRFKIRVVAAQRINVA